MVERLVELKARKLVAVKAEKKVVDSVVMLVELLVWQSAVMLVDQWVEWMVDEKAQRLVVQMAAMSVDW